MKQVKKEKDKRSFYFIILMFPSLILIVLAQLYSKQYLVWLSSSILLFGFQAILIKNFLDDYYGY